jgi:hypothetical protein
MYYKRCFVYLCYDFPIIDILCFTRRFCISVFCFPYYCYFLYHNRCFVYLYSVFPIVGILCFTSVVLYVFVLLSLLLVFYVSQALFCISVLWIPYNWYFISHKRCFVHKIPIIGKAEHRYTKQPLWNIKYQWWGNHNTDIQNNACET